MKNLSRYDVVPGVRKIAVVRANAIGDFIFSLPALEALRAAYPEAEIVLLAKEWHACFLHERPGPIDRVVVVPPYGGVSENPGYPEDAAELEAFFSAMRREHFAIAIQMHGGGRYSNPFTLRLGATLTIGTKTPDAVAPDRWMPYVYWQHEILRHLELVSLVGASPVMLEPELAVTGRDLNEALAAVPESDKPLVALHPGAGDPRRRWSPEKFAAVGDVLTRRGARVVVVGTRDEQDIDDAVVSSMKTEAQNLCGRLSLGGLVGLLSRCRVVISNDSGPLHLARAVGVATVGLYWCFNLVNAGPITRTRHRSAHSWRLECPVCGLNCMYHNCGHHVPFIDDIPTGEVISAALDLFCDQP
ncbi:MAG TPA: glycosyltransferase family 9 protein [Ktedonobacteraceae bacterium]|nr:glycosyltransferase family 9 protein [Ktedonobacteraceae bacterium]